MTRDRVMKNATPKAIQLQDYQPPAFLIDDVDRLLGERPWELALFGLFNALWERQGCLVVSAAMAPAAAGCVLPDLASRLAWGGVFRLESLDDDGRVAALRPPSGSQTKPSHAPTRSEDRSEGATASRPSAVSPRARSACRSSSTIR